MNSFRWIRYESYRRGEVNKRLIVRLPRLSVDQVTSLTINLVRRPAATIRYVTGAKNSKSGVPSVPARALYIT